MQAGDIVFVRGKGIISWFIRKFDKGEFSHVAMAVSPNHIIESDYSTRVRIALLNEKDYEVVELQLTNEERETIIHKGIDVVGVKYDYKQIIGYLLFTKMGSPNAYICSELIRLLLGKVGVTIKNEYIKPNELYKYLIQRNLIVD